MFATRGPRWYIYRMREKTGQAAVRRPGIAIRIDINPNELRALRIYALEHKSTVPKLLANEIRRLIKRK